MKRQPISVIMIAITMLLISAVPTDSVKWELKKESAEVAVYIREYPGTSFSESKAVTRFKSRLSSLIAVIYDVDKYPAWAHGCEVAKVLKEDGHTERYIYLRIDAPWPVSDRDVVLKFSMLQDPATKLVYIVMHDVPGYLEENPDFVRIPDLKGYWKLKPVSDDYVEITYRIYVNPGGYIPAWLSNTTAVQLPFNTVFNLRLFAGQGKYRTASFKYIKEPR